MAKMTIDKRNRPNRAVQIESVESSNQIKEVFTVEKHIISTEDSQAREDINLLKKEQNNLKESIQTLTDSLLSLNKKPSEIIKEIEVQSIENKYDDSQLKAMIDDLDNNLMGIQDLVESFDKRILDLHNRIDNYEPEIVEIENIKTIEKQNNTLVYISLGVSILAILLNLLN